MTTKINFKNLVLISLAAIALSSCSISLPIFSRTNQNQSNEFSISTASQIEALKREDYTVLQTTTGSAATSRFYLLFFPIGKHKTNSELFENAYYKAVDNLPDADALIMPRQQIKKFTVPLLLVNYNRREVTVTGVGISVKDKAHESYNTQK
jgi:hypothetical protein